MKKYERVKSNTLFNEIINKGKKVSNKLFTIFYMEKEDIKPNFGVAVPKRVGKAVTRNLLKRQTREILDKTKFMFKNNRNYIIIVKDKCLEESFINRLDSFKNLIGEINEK